MDAGDWALIVRGGDQGDDSATVRVVVQVGGKAPKASVEALVATLVKADVRRSLIEVRPIVRESDRKSPQNRSGGG